MKLVKILIITFAFSLTTLYAASLNEQFKLLNSPSVKSGCEQTAFTAGNATVRSDEAFLLNTEGIYFKKGELIFKVKDEFAALLSVRNAKSWGIKTASAGKGITLSIKFERGILLSSFPLNLKEKSGAAKIPEKFVEFLKNNEKVNLAAEILGAQLKNSELQVGIFETTFGYYYLKYDQDDNEESTLHYIRKSKYTGLYQIFEIAYQPIDRKIWEKTVSDFTVTALDIYAENTKKEDGVINTELTLKSNTELKGIPLSLKNQFYTFNKNTREIELKRVLTTDGVEVDGKQAEFIHAGNRLIIKFPQQIGRNEFVKIKVYTKGNVFEHPNGDNFWRFRGWAWYPQAQLKEEKATVKLTVKCPDNFTPFATGNTVSLKKEKGYATLISEYGNFIQRPVIAAGEYFEHSMQFNGRKCIVATHGTKKDRASKKLLKYFFAVSDFLSSGFRKPYPFNEQKIIETNYGFRYSPSIILVSKDIFDPKNESSEKINLMFVQKVSEAFWDGMILIPDKNENWISKSFSQYTAALAYTSLFKKKKVAEKKFTRILRYWKRGAELAKKGSTIYLASHITSRKKKDSYDKAHMLYDKGPLVLHALRLELRKKYGRNGEGMFFVWMNSILKSFNQNYVNTYDCIRLLNMITKEDWTPFFEKYVFGDQIPDINI